MVGWASRERQLQKREKPSVFAYQAYCRLRPHCVTSKEAADAVVYLQQHYVNITDKGAAKLIAKVIKAEVDEEYKQQLKQLLLAHEERMQHSSGATCSDAAVGTQLYQKSQHAGNRVAGSAGYSHIAAAAAAEGSQRKAMQPNGNAGSWQAARYQDASLPTRSNDGQAAATGSPAVTLTPAAAAAAAGYSSARTTWQGLHADTRVEHSEAQGPLVPPNIGPDPPMSLSAALWVRVAGQDSWGSLITTAVLAEHCMQENRDYIVSGQDVLLLDSNTGRVLAANRQQKRLHEALEAKHGVPIRDSGRTLASISLQSLLRLYGHVSGMTGTAVCGEGDFQILYDLRVLVVPTNRPVRRVDWPLELYRSAEEKDTAIVQLVLHAAKRGSPVLLGTGSVQESEHYRQLLQENVLDQLNAGVAGAKLAAREDVAVLNASPEAAAKEAAVIAQAGMPGAITIATSMAGRGTDILLGGDPRVCIQMALENLLIPKMLEEGGSGMVWVPSLFPGGSVFMSPDTLMQPVADSQAAAVAVAKSLANSICLCGIAPLPRTTLQQLRPLQWGTKQFEQDLIAFVKLLQSHHKDCLDLIKATKQQTKKGWTEASAAQDLKAILEDVWMDRADFRRRYHSARAPGDDGAEKCASGQHGAEPSDSAAARFRLDRHRFDSLVTFRQPKTLERTPGQSIYHNSFLLCCKKLCLLLFVWFDLVCPLWKEQLCSLDGLVVVCTSLLSNPRSEQQLRGRAGRQGEPGVSWAVCDATERYTQEIVGSWMLPPPNMAEPASIKNLQSTATSSHATPLSSMYRDSILHRSVANARKARASDARRGFAQEDQLLVGHRLFMGRMLHVVRGADPARARNLLQEAMVCTAAQIVQQYCSADRPPDKWDWDALCRCVNDLTLPEMCSHFTEQGQSQAQPVVMQQLVRAQQMLVRRQLRGRNLTCAELDEELHEPFVLTNGQLLQILASSCAASKPPEALLHATTAAFPGEPDSYQNLLRLRFPFVTQPLRRKALLAKLHKLRQDGNVGGQLLVFSPPSPPKGRYAAAVLELECTILHLLMLHLDNAVEACVLYHVTCVKWANCVVDKARPVQCVTSARMSRLAALGKATTPPTLHKAPSDPDRVPLAKVTKQTESMVHGLKQTVAAAAVRSSTQDSVDSSVAATSMALMPSVDAVARTSEQNGVPSSAGALVDSTEEAEWWGSNRDADGPEATASVKGSEILSAACTQQEPGDGPGTRARSEPKGAQVQQPQQVAPCSSGTRFYQDPQQLEGTGPQPEQQQQPWGAGAEEASDGTLLLSEARWRQEVHDRMIMVMAAELTNMWSQFLEDHNELVQQMNFIAFYNSNPENELRMHSRQLFDRTLQGSPPRLLRAAMLGVCAELGAAMNKDSNVFMEDHVAVMLARDMQTRQSSTVAAGAPIRHDGKHAGESDDTWVESAGHTTLKQAVPAVSVVFTRPGENQTDGVVDGAQHGNASGLSDTSHVAQLMSRVNNCEQGFAAAGPAPAGQDFLAEGTADEVVQRRLNSAVGPILDNPTASTPI